ncbi:MAG: hypothetical protein HQL47_12085, partial [Gammaproteobacteria bacterium]|nr:hypothetical protein [Gammaproteobacteria bacterium]
MDPETSYAHHAELLRMALPLMAKHRVPASPDNYAIWYQYVSGDNLRLNERVDELIAAGVPFSAELCLQLFKQFGSGCDIEKIEHIRGNLHNLMQDVNNSLTTADEQTDQFGGNLNQISSSINDSLP